MITCDVAVIGTGGVGSAALYHLAKSGAKVVGLDRFTPPHAHGSSHGQTRVIRLAYFEHPDYVPLLRRAYQAWNQLETATNRQLYFPTGALQIGSEQGVVGQGIRHSAELHHLAVDSLSHEEILQAYPGVVPPEDHVGMLERDAGYLLVSECIDTYLQLAKAHGAQLKTETAVQSWTFRDGQFDLQTDAELIHAKQVVVCGGAWAAQLMTDLKVPLQILRKHLYWYENDFEGYRHDSNFPVFLFETAAGIYYGFPQIDDYGVKLARHDAGQPIKTPADHSQDEDFDDRQQVESFVKSCLPRLSTRLTRQAACMYTMTPDENFLLGTHPEHEGLHFAAGLSGHGFKFASALGQILSELAIDGQTTSPIEFLSPARFS